MIANLPDKTGRSLDEWVATLDGCGLAKYGQIVSHLKTEHGVSHGYAMLITRTFLSAGSPEPSGDDLVNAQYEGGKAGLRPVYDSLVAVAQSLGDDVEIAPKKTSVSLRRSKQFALITAASRNRIDLGFNFAANHQRIA